MNSNNQVIYFGETDLFLPDKSYYENEETKEQLLGMFKMTTLQILKLYGYSDEEAQDILTKALAFDELLVPIAKNSVEKADYVKLYNPVSRKEVHDKAKTFDIIALADKLVQTEVDQLIVLNSNFIDKFNEIICEENFDIIKAWILLSNLKKFASDLTDELRIASGAFSRMLSGVSEAQTKEKYAFYQAYNRLSQSVGLYYGVNYFGPKAKADVENMVDEIISVYRERIENNTWLQQETKLQAITKLNTITVHVGYPEELPSYYDLYEVESYEEGSNLILESLKFVKLQNLDNFKKYNKEPNRNIWGMPASMVNAYYNPSNNQIVFPAAILQRPYYSLDQSASENYGGIGAVMAHEISHAFDNNGAKFDEFGSLKNWWTEDDLKAFEERSDDMIKLFDGVETGNGKCNGKLTVSENIADSGGIRCALEASKKHSDHNYEEFFQNWARVWRQKASPEFSKLLLTVDVHGPAVLRANMQLSNLIEFQEYYKLTKEDPMYLDKDKMLEIW
jgi:putative endopeptidase